jgi:four helix bundle protein
MNEFQTKLKLKMDEYVHLVYGVSRKFPKEELYGVTSQLRRAALSVILNYIEGYARQSRKDQKNFYRISYASLAESKYLIYFSLTEKYISKADYENAYVISQEIGAMLWKCMN